MSAPETEPAEMPAMAEVVRPLPCCLVTGGGVDCDGKGLAAVGLGPGPPDGLPEGFPVGVDAPPRLPGLDFEEDEDVDDINEEDDVLEEVEE